MGDSRAQAIRISSASAQGSSTLQELSFLQASFSTSAQTSPFKASKVRRQRAAAASCFNRLSPGPVCFARAGQEATMTATAQDNSVHMKERLHIVKEPVKRTSAFAPIKHAIAAIRVGQMVIVVDDEGRENEGDLTIAAEKVTPQAINFYCSRKSRIVEFPLNNQNIY
jgi:hypothetical protein